MKNKRHSLFVFLGRRVEGLIFLWLILFLTPFLLLGILLGVLAVDKKRFAAVRMSATRWLRFFLHGFSDVRKHWSALFSMERLSDLWRYVIEIELVDAINLISPFAKKSDDLRRVLVIKFGHLGDALHVVPMLRSLRAQRPEARVDFLVGPWCRELAARIPYVNDVLVYTPHLAMFHRGQNNGRFSFLRELAFLWKLRRRRYDLVISTSTLTPAEFLVIHAARAPRWLGANFPTDMRDLYYPYSEPRTVAYDSNMYEAERVGRLLEEIGLSAGDPRLEFPLTLTDKTVPLARDERPLVIMAPGAGWLGKMWPAERFAQLADLIIEKYNVRVVLVGAPTETVLSEEIQNKMRHSPVDLIGKTIVGQMAALIKQANLFIGNDSGPLHFAAAFDVPAIVFFGPTVSSKWVPASERYVALQHNFSCSGCLCWHVKAQCLHRNECINSISVDEAMTAVDGLAQFFVPSKNGVVL